MPTNLEADYCAQGPTKDGDVYARTEISTHSIEFGNGVSTLLESLCSSNVSPKPSETPTLATDLPSQDQPICLEKPTESSQSLSNTVPETTLAFSLPVNQNEFYKIMEDFRKSLEASLEQTLSASLSGLT